MAGSDDAPTPRQTGSHAIMSTACAELIDALERLRAQERSIAQEAGALIQTAAIVRAYVESWPLLEEEKRPTQAEKNLTWSRIFGLRESAHELAASRGQELTIRPVSRGP